MVSERFGLKMAKISPIHQTYYYAAPPARIFSALTDPRQLARWFVKKAVVDLRKGGPFRLTWSSGYVMRGKVRAVEPAKRVDLLWVDRIGGTKVLETVARFDLKRRGRGTLLTLTHRGFKSGKKWVGLHGEISSGWAYYLVNLRSVIEHDVDLRSSLDEI